MIFAVMGRWSSALLSIAKLLMDFTVSLCTIMSSDTAIVSQVALHPCAMNVTGCLAFLAYCGKVAGSHVCVSSKNSCMIGKCLVT